MIFFPGGHFEFRWHLTKHTCTSPCCYGCDLTLKKMTTSFLALKKAYIIKNRNRGSTSHRKGNKIENKYNLVNPDRLQLYFCVYSARVEISVAQIHFAPNPLSLRDASKHHFKSLKTDIIFLQRRGFRRKFLMKLFKKKLPILFFYFTHLLWNAVARHKLKWVKNMGLRDLSTTVVQSTSHLPFNCRIHFFPSQ